MVGLHKQITREQLPKDDCEEGPSLTYPVRADLGGLMRRLACKVAGGGGKTTPLEEEARPEGTALAAAGPP